MLNFVFKWTQMMMARPTFFSSFLFWLKFRVEFNTVCTEFTHFMCTLRVQNDIEYLLFCRVSSSFSLLVFVALGVCELFLFLRGAHMLCVLEKVKRLSESRRARIVNANREWENRQESERRAHAEQVIILSQRMREHKNSFDDDETRQTKMFLSRNCEEHNLEWREKW